MLWDLFCRVVDNLGDVGFCWRLASDLAQRGERVRLWIDDAAALAWMAPGGRDGVSVGAFDAAGEPGDVVVEAFGCDPPPAFVERMAARQPVWVNLEHLSAEPYVERSHGLPSPQRNGLVKWFFFPGFTAATGGLVREPGLLAEREAFDRDAWLAARGWARTRGERVVLLFCYSNPALPALLQTLATQPTLLLTMPGAATAAMTGAAGAAPPSVRRVALPFVAQRDFDRLLWSADIAFVRGEDSLVRAVWSGKPFVWQAYPQHDGAHAAKVEALLERLPSVAGLPALWRAWNGLQPAWPAVWPDSAAWHAAVGTARSDLAALPDLTTTLLAFAAAKADRLDCLD